MDVFGTRPTVFEVEDDVSQIVDIHYYVLNIGASSYLFELLIHKRQARMILVQVRRNRLCTFVPLKKVLETHYWRRVIVPIVWSTKSLVKDKSKNSGSSVWRQVKRVEFIKGHPTLRSGAYIALFFFALNLAAPTHSARDSENQEH